MIEIKALGRLDVDILKNVAPEVFDDVIDIRRAEEFLADPRHHLVVAVENGLVVGFVSAVHYVHPDKPRSELWINEVAVAPTHQNRGLGKQMLRAILDKARSVGCAEAWVLTDSTNMAALRLYSAIRGAKVSTDHVMFTFPLDSGAAPSF
jgi:ribosomal protein S18 acetylase RimI-like enzyme